MRCESGQGPCISILHMLRTAERQVAVLHAGGRSCQARRGVVRVVLQLSAHALPRAGSMA